MNHSQGEIVNARGFTTNLIESKWSALKRWIRKRYSGTLPNSNERSKWTRLIAEHRFRTFMAVECCKEMVVPIEAFAKAFKFKI